MNDRREAIQTCARAVLFLGALSGVLFAPGCGSSSTDEPANTGGQTASGGSGGGAGAGSGGQGDASGGSAPVLCGGAYRRECAEGSACLFQDGCGTVGHCTRRPRDCDAVEQPVCGCDGNTYSNECIARLAGVSVRDEGACDEAQQFPCGPYQCAKTSFCVDKGEASGHLWRHGCLDLPEGCTGCDCLGDVPGCLSGSTCQETAGGIRVTCE
jgi:hypothetical protein